MPIEYPIIRDYKSFYIQTDIDNTAIDVTSTYGLIVKTSPLPDLPAMKQPASNDWKDEDGDDEYLENPHFQAINYELMFYIRATSQSGIEAVDVLTEYKRAFFDKICTGEFSFYDAYWKLGRRKVRYVSYSEESKKQGSNWARQIFKIVFKINDPRTEMKLENQRIVEK